MTDWTPAQGNDPTLSGPPSPKGPGRGKPMAIVGVLGVVALAIGVVVGYFALGGKKSTTTPPTSTTQVVTSTTKKKPTTSSPTSGPVPTDAQSVDPLSIPAGFNAYRAGGGNAFAVALPKTWNAVLLDSGALSHEADVHKSNANLVSLLNSAKSLKGEGGIFFAYDGNSASSFEDNINVIENTSVTSLPSNIQDTVRQQLGALSTPATNIQFSTSQVSSDPSALVATYEVVLSGGTTAYGVQAYFTGSDGLYVLTMTFGSADTRQQVATAAFPTVNVP